MSLSFVNKICDILVSMTVSSFWRTSDGTLEYLQLSK